MALTGLICQAVQLRPIDGLHRHSPQADMTTGEEEIALLTGKLADANSTAEDAIASAAQANAQVQLLSAACDALHNDVSALTAERVRILLLCLPEGH